MDPVVSLLADLVAIPSVNPSLVAGASGEGDVGGMIAQWLRRQEIDVEVRPVLPGRPNVVGIVDSGVPGPTLLLCGHTDTVGTEGMERPFSPVVRDGFLFGRGAQDMKAGLAAMLHAAAVLAAGGGPRRGRLLVACVIDEEYASAGADDFVRGWTADAAVITEPTGLAIGIAHKGFSAATITVHGRAAHGSRPADGVDAILHMGRVLARLEALDRELQRRSADPWLGTPSLHASTIEGGGELSTYPAVCRLDIERRTLPGEPESAAADELAAVASALPASDQRFRADVRLLLARPPYSIAAGHWLPRMLAGAAGACSVDAVPAGLSYWTDAAILGAAGIPAVVFGPRGSGLHGPVEQVRLEDVVACRDVLVKVAERFADAAPAG